MLMNNRNLIVILLLYVLPLAVSGENFDSRFLMYYEEGDTAGQRRTLRLWERAQPDNPELYIAYLHYYAGLSDGNIEITGEADDSGDLDFDTLLLMKGITWIDRGIEAFPDRLDMRFDKLYALQQAGLWDELTVEIVRTLDYGAAHEYRWKWSNGKSVADGKDFMLSSILDYQSAMLEEEDAALYLCVRNSALAILKYFPDNVESLVDAGSTYFLSSDYDTALAYFRKAEELSPDDVTVLYSLGSTYRFKGDTARARACYERMAELSADDPELQAFAREMIDQLGTDD